MQDFLREHANSSGIFDKVCAPLLRVEVQRRYPHLLVALNRVAGNAEDHGQVRSLSDDPDLAALQADPVLGDVDFQRAALRYRFGVVLYREIRNQWVHETIESRNVGHPTWDTTIRYMNHNVLDENEQWRLTHPLILPIPRLLEIYAEALNSFETACTAQRIDPTPDRGD
jgi:hypothetical protein